VDYYSNDAPRGGQHAWLARRTGHLQCEAWSNPGGAGQVGTATTPRIPAGRADRAVPAHTCTALPVSRCRRDRAHRHAGRDRADLLPAALAECTAAGYLATERPEFRAYFDRAPHPAGRAPRRRRVLHPAVIHAPAPTGRPTCAGWPTYCRSPPRSAAPWTVDRRGGVQRDLPDAGLARAAHDPARTARAVAASAEGYPFPTNLDRTRRWTGSHRPARPTWCTARSPERWTPDRLRGRAGEADRRRIAR